jgi:EAL domain-containing protein (putative c-di-GMP-specific phosphodiesterase class I)
MDRRPGDADENVMEFPWLPPELQAPVAAGARIAFFDRAGEAAPTPAGFDGARVERETRLRDADYAAIYPLDLAGIVGAYQSALAYPGRVQTSDLRLKVDDTWSRLRSHFVNLLDVPAIAAVVRVLEPLGELPSFDDGTDPAHGEAPWVRVHLDSASMVVAVEGMPDEIYGVPAGELVGRMAYDFVHPDDITAVMKAGIAAMADGADVALNHRLHRADGTVLLVAATLTVGGRVPNGWIVQLRDAGRTLRRELAEAIAGDQLFLVYQPVVEVGTARMLGAEALVRWIHPERGFLPPDQFIPLAESSTIIVDLGAWVLRKACAEAVTWPDHLHVAVNLSVRQLADRGIVAIVAKALAETGLTADRLVLEVTESALAEDADRAIRHLGLLKDLGVRLAIDDFGTGYSSLNYLKRMPVDVLKVDRSFVAGLGEDPGDTAIVSSVIALAHTFGLQAVAEGVETAAQHRQLVAMGCDSAQGYLWSRPAPADQFQQLIDRPLAVSE